MKKDEPEYRWLRKRHKKRWKHERGGLEIQAVELGGNALIEVTHELIAMGVQGGVSARVLVKE